MKLFTHIHNDEIIRPFVKMLNREDGHYYLTESGKIYPSITTVFKSFPNEGIEAWKRREPDWKRISKESTDVGELLHKLIESFLNNNGAFGFVEQKYYDPSKYAFSPFQLFDCIKPTLMKIDNIHALETKLYSDEMGIAGTVDCIGEYEGVLSIIDFKNSRKRKTKSFIHNYLLQVTAYANMWKFCTGMDIKQGVIMIANWNDGKGEPGVSVFKVNLEDYQTELWRLLVEYEQIKEEGT